jgi:hypothetical protein
MDNGLPKGKKQRKTASSAGNYRGSWRTEARPRPPDRQFWHFKKALWN